MRKTFTQLVAEAEARPEQEWFQFANHRWDVAKAYRWIDEGLINYEKAKIDIAPYAEGVLALNRDEQRIGNSFFVRIDPDHVKKIDPKSPQYNSPGILLSGVKEYDDASLVIDGNHRLAARYMNGENGMEFYVIDGNLSKALQGTNKSPPKNLRKSA